MLRRDRMLFAESVAIYLAKVAPSGLHPIDLPHPGLESSAGQVSPKTHEFTGILHVKHASRRMCEELGAGAKFDPFGQCSCHLPYEACDRYCKSVACTVSNDLGTDT